VDSRETLPPGTLLDGSYRIVRVVGSGGFGVTYEAEDSNLGTVVAIKEYYPLDFGERAGTMSVRAKSDRHRTTFDWGRSNFLTEARTLARFEHPSIVRVTRVFEAHSTAYMVMRFEQGRSYEDWLRWLGRPPTQEELDRIVAPVLDALQMLHAANFLHRDIAPDNIIVRADGTPVLLDFGAARRAVAEMSRALTGIVKAGYSPHEQYSSDGRLQGPWSDLYALGATLYRAISGNPPDEAMLRLDEDRMPSAAKIGKGIYRPSFLAAIDACLKVRPSQRPRSVAELRPKLLGTAKSKNSLKRFIDPLNGLGTLRSRPQWAEKQNRSVAPAKVSRLWVSAVAGTLVLVGGAYAGYRYARSPTADQRAGRATKDTQQAAPETTELKSRQDADEAANRQVAAEAQQRRKDADDAAKREKETREEEVRRQALLDKEREDTAKKKADEEAPAAEQALKQLDQGKAYAAEGDHSRAIAAFDEAIRLDPKLAAGYWLRGVSRAIKGDHDRAISDYEEAIRLDPLLADAYFGRGFSFSVKGDQDRAVADYNEAIRLNPKLAGAFWQRGLVLMKKGDLDRALTEYNEAVRVDPTLARAYANRANVFEIKGEYIRAITDYDEALRLQPDLPDAHYGRGFSHAILGDYDQAIADYDAAIRLNPNAALVYWRRGTCYSLKGDFDRAIKDYDEALRLNPKLAGAYWQRGVLYANKGDHTQAVNDYTEAIRLDPQLVRAYWDRGNSRAIKGDHTRAIADFNEAIRLDPKLTGAYLSRGASYEKSGNRTQAMKDYRRAAELDPTPGDARSTIQGTSQGTSGR
jgi:tetratricopeptide (TPR) repeat protein/serine/threonine protein kinase